MVSLLSNSTKMPARALAVLGLLIFLTASHGTLWAQHLVRIATGVPAMAFAPPGAVQQLAVLYDTFARRLR